VPPLPSQVFGSSSWSCWRWLCSWGWRCTSTSSSRVSSSPRARRADRVRHRCGAVASLGTRTEL